MAMSVVWTGMLLIALISGLLTGQGEILAAAAMEGAQNAITVGLSIAGPLCLWNGVGTLLQRNGMSGGLMRLLKPILCRLFPVAYKDQKAASCISANVTANLLGLGNAATPMGIAAVKRMKELTKGVAASDEMCRFIVLNTASVQLLPTTVATVRSAAGAAKPFDILPAVWITSVCSVTAGLLFARILQGRRQ